MDPNKYLQQVLTSQNLDDTSNELKRIKAHRESVESLLKEKYGTVPIIRYGGSKAKGTMNRESYDLDIICYFPHDSTVAGQTLESIYNDVCKTLEKKFYVERKTSALRLRGKDADSYQVDFHVDVVPGRYVDDKKQDTFLHQENCSKERLKTNLEVHIDHVKNSGVVSVIRLMKLWRVRNGLRVRQFVLELLVIKLLQDRKSDTLSKQLEYLWQEFRDHADDLAVEDPANPDGNDLSGVVDEARLSLSSVASQTLSTLGNSGWEAIFGEASNLSDDDKRGSLPRLVATVRTPTKPWSQQ